jgi:hypothetical protein
MTNPAKTREGEALPERSAVDIAIEEAGGDPRRAIEALLSEVDLLSRRLALVQGATSYGFSRGWARQKDLSCPDDGPVS